MLNNRTDQKLLDQDQTSSLIMLVNFWEMENVKTQNQRQIMHFKS